MSGVVKTKAPEVDASGAFGVPDCVGELPLDAGPGGHDRSRHAACPSRPFGIRQQRPQKHCESAPECPRTDRQHAALFQKAACRSSPWWVKPQRRGDIGYCGAGVIHPKGTAQVQDPGTPGSMSSSREAVNLPPAGSSRRVGPWRRGWLRLTVDRPGEAATSQGSWGWSRFARTPRLFPLTTKDVQTSQVSI
jgi:hypothetical protein